MADLAYTALKAAADDPAWKDRVRVGLELAAITIGGADASDRLARSVIADPNAWTDRFALPVALGFIGQPDLATSHVTDGDIFSRINFLWPAFKPPA